MTRYYLSFIEVLERYKEGQVQIEIEWLIGSNARRYIKVYQITRHGNKELVIVYRAEKTII